MTGRERVLAAFEHRDMARPPVDFSGHRSSGISAIAYPKLRQYLSLPEKTTRVYDPLQQMAIVDNDVLDQLGIDAIELGRAFALEDQCWVDWVLPDGTPCQMPAWATPERAEGEWVLRSRTGRVMARMPNGALYFEQAYSPFAEREDLDALSEAFAEMMWTGLPSPPGPITQGEGGLERLAEGAAQLRCESDRAIIGLFGGNLFEIAQWLYGMDSFFMMLASEPARVHDLLDRLVEFYLPELEAFLGAVGEHIDIIMFGDDLGMQTGPQISPAMYRDFFRDRHSRMWHGAREMAEVKVMLHCCGGIRELLPDLIDAGLDAINPVQTNCAGMDAAGLKRDFGKEIVFWGGGCDTGRVLPQGTPDEVRSHTRAQIAIMSQGGGFVFQQVHNILADVPPKNIVAMFEVAREGLA